jgi:hypothetical protein
MSLNKFTDDLKEKEWMKINCDTIIADNVKFRTTDGNIVNLKTPTLGGNNYVLTTDGVGSCAFTDIGVLTPPTAPSLFTKTQNIDLAATVVGNTQINGTTQLYSVNVDTELKVKTGDGLGYNDFSTPTLGTGGYVLSTDGSGNLTWISNGILSISDLETKTQNISLANTTPNITEIGGTLRIPLITSLNGGCQIDLTTNTITATATSINLNATTLQQNSKDLINTDGNKNITTTLTTTQTVFTNDQELITKKYVDNNSGGGGTSLDFSGLVGSTIKTNLLTSTTQTAYGVVEQYTALNNLSAGQPVIYDYTSGNIKCSSIGSLPAQHEIIGICLDDTTAGNTANILSTGYATARRTSTTLPSFETVILDNITNGTTRSLTNNTTFTDSGSGGFYQPNENYLITFDAGVGYTVNCTVNSFGFEHTTNQMYDRLGIQTSTDGISYNNISVQWLQTSSTTTPPYSSSFAGASWNSGASDNGWILPKDEPRAILLGGVPGNTFPALINLGTRYVRFYFFSDVSSQDDGWNITLQPNTPYPVSAISVAEGTTLYLDNVHTSKVSTDNTSQIVLGYCAFSDANNDSLLINVRPPRI